MESSDWTFFRGTSLVVRGEVGEVVGKTNVQLSGLVNWEKSWALLGQ